ncbi:hypothetical protein AAG906_026729 [Vitis piasezkii]
MERTREKMMTFIRHRIRQNLKLVQQGIWDCTPSDVEDSDGIIDGGDEWYGNTERKKKAMAELGPFYIGMGVSDDEEGARHRPSLMPGGSSKAHKYIEDILLKRAAQVSIIARCDLHWREGFGNFIKMVQNGIEYVDM